MHCLHGLFRCHGQPMPALPGVPQTPILCNVSGSTTAKDLISDLRSQQPATESRRCETGRIIAIWQGIGTRKAKLRWIMDQGQCRVTPKSFALAYAHFRSKCKHVETIRGWSYELASILEVAWKLSKNLAWQAPSSWEGP